MADLIQNTSPKHNPITTIFGVIFLTVAVMMLLVEYLLPAFVELKGEIPFAWWAPILVLGLGLLLLFMNDRLFDRIADRADKIAAKKTGTDQ